MAVFVTHMHWAQWGPSAVYKNEARTGQANGCTWNVKIRGSCVMPIFW